MGPAEGKAAWLTVDCSEAATGDFTSINQAISSLTGPPPAAGDWDYVVLLSDCTESVLVSGGRRIWIAPEGDPWPWAGSTTNGVPARITAAAADQAVVTVQGPREVTLVHLILSGGNAGLRVGGNASVEAYGVSAEDSSGPGFGIGPGDLTLHDGVSAFRNGYYGISVDLGGTVHPSGQSDWLEDLAITISENSGGGIRLDRGSLYATTGYNVEDNQGPGVTMYAGVGAFGEYKDNSSIRGNQGGAFVSEGSRATFWGNLLLSNNGPYGIYVEDGGNASFTGAELGPVVVEGHSNVGLDVMINSQAAIHGQHQIRNNGSASEPTSAGIRIDGGSHLLLDDTGQEGADLDPPVIADNVGPGILLDYNSSIDAREAIFRGNTGEAVRVLHESVAYLGPNSQVAANAGGPIRCDSTSLVVTSLFRRTGACRNVEAPDGPRPPRPQMPR
jgi:hypothetical protein